MASPVGVVDKLLPKQLGKRIIPATLIKAKNAHRVPLSPRAIFLL